MSLITALRLDRRGHVLVELDGSPWRALPVDVAARAALRVGEELDRPRLRELRRELRRAEALGVATRALRRRELPARAVSARLERAGVAPRERERALETLVRAGYLDDRRFAAGRAAELAERGWGDAAITDDLERRGVGESERAGALGGLAPERERALRVVERRGRTRATAVYLSRRGFGDDALEAALGQAVAEEA